MNSIFRRIGMSAATMIFTASLITTSANAQGFTKAVEVTSQNGETLGYTISNADAVIAQQKLDNAVKNSYIELGKSYSIVPMNAVSNADEIFISAVNTSQELISGYGLYVDGKLAVVSESDSNITSALNAYKVENGYNESSKFIKNVTIEKGLYISSSLTGDIKNDVKALNLQLDGAKEIDTQIDSKKVPNTQLNDKKANKQVKKSKAPAKTEVQKMVWPVNKNGSGAYVSCGWYGYSGHTGVDIACKKGTEIYAAKSGTVVLAEYHKSYGYQLIIDHGNGISTRYAHCTQLFAKVGDKVTQGETIATVGRTGKATGNHLHFEVLKKGKAVNPKPYLGY